jgi:hypothetical protein
MTFRKLDQFPSSVVETEISTLLGPLEAANHHWIIHYTRQMFVCMLVAT